MFVCRPSGNFRISISSGPVQTFPVSAVCFVELLFQVRRTDHLQNFQHGVSPRGKLVFPGTLPDGPESAEAAVHPVEHPGQIARRRVLPPPVPVRAEFPEIVFPLSAVGLLTPELLEQFFFGAAQLLPNLLPERFVQSHARAQEHGAVFEKEHRSGKNIMIFAYQRFDGVPAGILFRKDRDFFLRRLLIGIVDDLVFRPPGLGEMSAGAPAERRPLDVIQLPPQLFQCAVVGGERIGQGRTDAPGQKTVGVRLCLSIRTAGPVDQTDGNAFRRQSYRG